MAVARWYRSGAAFGLCIVFLASAQPVAHATEPTPIPADVPPDGLASAIDEALTSRALSSATVGVHVFDLETGRSLYDRNADTPLNPASNTKVITTAAALRILGPEHQFVTQILRDDDALSGTKIRGDVYLRCTGDPSLVTEDIYAMVSELWARGVRNVTGGVTVDNTAFDRDELPPGFDQKEEMAAYRAPSSAASVNFNTFVVHVRPATKSGTPAIAAIDPPVPSVDFENAVTTARGHRARLWADVSHDDGTDVLLRGSMGTAAGSRSFRYPIAEPSVYTGELLALALQQRGIKLGRKAVHVAAAPDDAATLVTHYSEPLSVLIRPVNKFSNNFMAEQLLKSLDRGGQPASFDRAILEVRQALTALGIDLEGSVSGNGSGLYDTNRYTPRQITSVLAQMYEDFRYRADFLASLAVMGVDGTTRSRLRGSPSEGWARVKTGTLNGISALSGYVGAPHRDPIAFSILFNDLAVGASYARRVQDEVVQILAEHATRTALAPTP